METIPGKMDSFGCYKHRWRNDNENKLLRFSER
jgi:hypothetical protein